MHALMLTKLNMLVFALSQFW